MISEVKSSGAPAKSPAGRAWKPSLGDELHLISWEYLVSTMASGWGILGALEGHPDLRGWARHREHAMRFFGSQAWLRRQN
jgi:hypothetical protein